jgi:hypothetical protein
VRDNSCRRSADVLGHADGCILDLIVARLPAQLGGKVNDLIDARRADWVAARLQAAHRGNRDAPARADLAIAGGKRAFAGFGKPGRFQAESRHDREGIVQLKDINVIRADACDLICFFAQALIAAASSIFLRLARLTESVALASTLSGVTFLRVFKTSFETRNAAAPADLETLIFHYRHNGMQNTYHNW